jgi:hypothetical protein
MNMSEYDALAQGIHAKAEEAKAAASRTAVYKETLSKSVAQYEKKYGVKLGDPENLDLAALKSALLQEKASLGDEVKKLADRFNEIKNKDYAAEEERNLKASESQPGIQASEDSAGSEDDDEDEMTLDDEDTIGETAAQSADVDDASPKSAFQGIASAVAQQSANAQYPEYEDYEEDYDEGESAAEEPEESEAESAGSKEASFADIIRDQAVVTSSPYDTQEEPQQAESSADSSDDIDLSSLL